jgi:hypothetical protein
MTLWSAILSVVISSMHCLVSQHGAVVLICMRCCKFVPCGGGGACGVGLEDRAASVWFAVCCVRDE